MDPADGRFAQNPRPLALFLADRAKALPHLLRVGRNSSSVIASAHFVLEHSEPEWCSLRRKRRGGSDQHRNSREIHGHCSPTVRGARKAKSIICTGALRGAGSQPAPLKCPKSSAAAIASSRLQPPCSAATNDLCCQYEANHFLHSPSKWKMPDWSRAGLHSETCRSCAKDRMSIFPASSPRSRPLGYRGQTPNEVDIYELFQRRIKSRQGAAMLRG